MREPKGNIGTVLASGPFGRVLKPVRFQRAQAGAWDLQRAELSRPVRMKAVGLAVVGLSLVLLQCCGGEDHCAHRRSRRDHNFGDHRGGNNRPDDSGTGC